MVLNRIGNPQNIEDLMNNDHVQVIERDDIIEDLVDKIHQYAKYTDFKKLRGLDIDSDLNFMVHVRNPMEP